MRSSFKKYSDFIQFLSIIFIGLGMLGGFWAYCEEHFAKAGDVENMRTEVHLIFEKLIPEAERDRRHGP